MNMDKDLFLNYLKTYLGISAMVREYSYQEILENAAVCIRMKPEELEKYPMGGYSKGGLDGAYKYVLQDIIKNIRYYDWLFERLEDNDSKRVFTNLMQYRIVPDISYIEQAYDAENHQYFDKEFINCDCDEVFVDCGGYIGDTTEDFIHHYKEYKHIYVYEPLKENALLCEKNLEKYASINIQNCGVGERSTSMCMSGSGASGSFMGNASGEESKESDEIKIVSLDEDIKEPVTFIKMDVEGFEIPALLGAKNHIRNEQPKLAICTYHIISDMWEIPQLILAMNSNYTFYIRHYMKTQNWETVLYAIPKKEKKENIILEKYEKKPRVVAMAPYDRGWSNVELIKDCGLIPYLLYKNHECDVTMVGAKGDEYPYYDKYIKGVKLEFLDNGSEGTKLKYIDMNAAQIDCLILRGCYSSNFNVAKRYKELHPQGKIYVGLDANSSWMDRIIWDAPEFMEFMNCCDIIATSCRAMQEHLNVKWPWKIEHIPNGYYSFESENQKFSKNLLSQKENIIITVGRLGAEQKATHVLMEAFALIGERISGWKLQLVGNIQTEFQEYIKEYFERFPQLRDRVVFAGAVNDRESLLEMYKKARIFALPSICEGGTPNVIAEALNYGCVIAITKIDAYIEAIANGKCGLASEIDDIAGFAAILEKLCMSNNLHKMAEQALEYGTTHFNMERIVAELYELLFGGKNGETDC